MSLTKVVKRDGRVVDFDKVRIVQAIYKASKEAGLEDYKLAEKLADGVCKKLRDEVEPGGVPTVEQIQDVVEKVLIDNGYYKIAKAYILYRSLHAQIRTLVDDYLEKRSWLVNENANMTYSLQALNFHISSQVISQYWLHRIYKDSPEIRDAHLSGDFHIHNLSILGPYCVGWDLLDLLLMGFRGVRGKIEAKPAKHLRSALGQVVNFFFTLQGEAAGAQAFSNFDTLLAPFIRYDRLSYREVKQTLQEFIFNMNVPTRVGFQTPFTNITIDVQVPKFMENQPVVIGGEVMEDTYSSFQEEMNIFNEALTEVMMEGDASERVFTFPIPTINIVKETKWDSEVYYRIFELTAKYGIPYFANFINSDMKPEDVRSMCCHLRLDKRELLRRGGGLFSSNPLTGSIGVITINMPRIGYLSRSEKDFFERLSSLMELAKIALEKKRLWLEKFTDKGLYPYSKFYLRNIKKNFGKYWENHFSTIGLVGMNECCLNFLECTIADPDGLKFSEKVLDFMKKKLLEFQEETGNLYNLEATPAEGASHRLAMIDKRRYPDIIVANNDEVEQGASPYYTNSTQLPVHFTDDLFEALRLQETLQTKYTGGTVFHVWLGEDAPSAESVGALIRKICENFRIPYFTITPTFSICPIHGYIFGKKELCPKCLIDGKKTYCEVYSRVVGYLRPVEQWNEGKREEFKQRKTYDKIIHEIEIQR